MHSRIYQISTQQIAVDDYISESDFIDHWFVGSIADYVDEDVDLAEEKLYFRRVLEQRNVVAIHDEESFEILPNGKTEYFKHAFDSFVEAVKKAVEVKLEDFANDNGCGGLVYEIKSSYNDEFEWYVSSEEFDIITFDTFIRNAEPGKRYYIGGVLDYHW